HFGCGHYSENRTVIHQRFLKRVDVRAEVDDNVGVESAETFKLLEQKARGDFELLIRSANSGEIVQFGSWMNIHKRCKTLRRDRRGIAAEVIEGFWVLQTENDVLITPTVLIGVDQQNLGAQFCE